MTLLEIANTGSTSIMLEDNLFGVIIGWNVEENTITVHVPDEAESRSVACRQVSDLGGGALRQRPKDASYATMLDIMAALERRGVTEE